MNLEQNIFEILKPISCPATHMVRPKNLPSISYSILDRRPTIYGDGKPIREAAHCQVEIYTSDGKAHPIVQDVKEAMGKAGWQYVKEEDGMETGPGVYQKPLVFYLEFSNQNGGK
ncbi:MAG: hypothetical protein FWE42_05710 [Defluviitaleaceae bacterium]|nr:hypothetical protein [Defluviitaleaceae bacterium]